MQTKFVISSHRAVFILSCYILLVFNIGFWHYLLQHVIFRNNVIFWLTVPILMLCGMNLYMQLLF